MKYFIWRFCRSNLPLRYPLRSKGVLVPISCAMCVGDIEHLFHLFFDCSFAVACWRRVHLQYDMNNVDNASVWLLNMLSSESYDNIVKIDLFIREGKACLLLIIHIFFLQFSTSLNLTLLSCYLSVRLYYSVQVINLTMCLTGLY